MAPRNSINENVPRIRLPDRVVCWALSPMLLPCSHSSPITPPPVGLASIGYGTIKQTCGSLLELDNQGTLFFFFFFFFGGRSQLVVELEIICAGWILTFNPNKGKDCITHQVGTLVVFMLRHRKRQLRSTRTAGSESGHTGA